MINIGVMRNMNERSILNEQIKNIKRIKILNFKRSTLSQDITKVQGHYIINNIHLKDKFLELEIKY